MERHQSETGQSGVSLRHRWTIASLVVTQSRRRVAAFTTVQLNIATEGGSGTPVPDFSIEVDDVDAAYARAKTLGHDIIYYLTDEPWGVRRFYLRDPAGKLVNILSHAD